MHPVSWHAHLLVVEEDIAQSFVIKSQYYYFFLGWSLVVSHKGENLVVMGLIPTQPTGMYHLGVPEVPCLLGVSSKNA